MKKKITTQLFYRFDRTLMEDGANHPMWLEQPMAELQAFGRKVWAIEAPHRACPTIVAGPGNVGGYSYYQATRHRVELSRGGRCVGVLLHEMAHALTPWWAPDHGVAFTRRCLRLYRDYAGLDPAYIQLVALATGLTGR